MADSEVRQKFEAWLGLETCPVHWDESAEKNAWYGFEAGMRAGEIARWIPVEEKLPPESGEYVVLSAAGVESADWFSDSKVWDTVRGYGWEGESRTIEGVTQWQPLPAAPEEKP